MVEIHDPGNTEKKGKIYAFVSVDDNGMEGLLGFKTLTGEYVPLITGSDSTAEVMKGPAEEISRATGKQVRLVTFARTDEVLWETKNG